MININFWLVKDNYDIIINKYIIEINIIYKLINNKMI